MPKTVSEKKTKKATPKAAASYSTTKKNSTRHAVDNPSKYAPGKDSDLEVKTINAQDGLKKLFSDSIKDLYWAENQLVKALPKMAKAAGSNDLRKAIFNHLEETRTHVERLEKIFELLGKKVQSKKCDAMEGLTKEGEGVIEDTVKSTPARDLGIIMASQKVEHYEIAAYSGLIRLANKLKHAEISDILSQSLAEEQASDELLGRIANGIS
ncbi:MAG: ferritin-like domain-containing protein [Ferruginibacter sp.]